MEAQHREASAMAMFHHRTDVRTGEMVMIGKSGREVSALGFRAIDDAAKAGEAEALAVTRDLDWSIDGDGRPISPAQAQALILASISECSCCREEARAAMGRLGQPRGARVANTRAREHAVRRRKAARAARAKNRN